MSRQIIAIGDIEHAAKMKSVPKPEIGLLKYVPGAKPSSSTAHRNPPSGGEKQVSKPEFDAGRGPQQPKEI